MPGPKIDGWLAKLLAARQNRNFEDEELRNSADIERASSVNSQGFGGTNQDDLLDFSGSTADLHVGGKNGDDTILGGSGDDNLDGNNGDDSIDGGDGDDTINGNNGDDSLDGGGGDDRIDGNNGDDTVSGGEGDDTIDGGNGFDTATYEGSILDFTVEDAASSSHDFTVADQNAADGDEDTDQLDDVEALQFDDYTLFLDGTNNGPMIVAADQTTDEDTATAFSAAVYDFDGDTISIDNVSFTGAGTFSFTTSPLTPLLGTGVQLNFAFDPDGNYESLGDGDTEVETVTIEVSDGNGGTQMLTFDVTITGVNDAPVAQDDAFTVDEDTQLTGNVLADNGNGVDDDIDGPSLGVEAAVITTANGGTVTLLADGWFTYDPAPNYFGSDSFDYTLTDGSLTDTGTVSIMVNPINDAPVTDAPDDPVETRNEADGGASIDLNTRVSDVDGDGLTIVSARFLDPATGQPYPVELILTDGVVSFDPADFGLADNESLTVQIQYSVMDDSGEPNDTAVGFVDVVINGADDSPPPVNQAPTAGLLDLTGDPNLDEAGGDITFDLSSVIDDADGDPLTVVALLSAGGQEINFTQVGETIIVDPQQLGLNLGESELVELSFVIDDGSGAPNSQATGAIRFVLDGADDGPPPDPDNTAPVANSFSITADEQDFQDPLDNQIVIDLNAQVSDADGDNLTIIGVSVLGGILVDFTLEQGILYIDPASLGLDTGESLIFQLEYVVEDDSGESNNTTVGTITVDLAGFTEPTPPEPGDTVVLDFEPFSSLEGSSIDITGDTYLGFTFAGSAVVVETDEVNGGREPNGVVSGQTTILLDDNGVPILDENGEEIPLDNVLVGTFSTVEVPVLDESGEPVLDERGDPVTESVLDEQFAIFGPGTTLDFDEVGFQVSTGAAGDPPDLTEISLPLDETIGEAFDLDSVSLNIPAGSTTITITTYAFDIVEVPFGTSTTISEYYLEYVVVDTFEFIVDGSTPALELDFNDPAFMDALGNTNVAGFDDIHALTIETEDGSVIVLDDFLVTL